MSVKISSKMLWPIVLFAAIVGSLSGWVGSKLISAGVNVDEPARDVSAIDDRPTTDH